jgi:threonine dehydratase
MSMTAVQQSAQAPTVTNTHEENLETLCPSDLRGLFEATKTARLRLENLLKPTPLIHSSELSVTHNCDVFFKPENLQLTGSFKVRGAFNKICSLSAADKDKGVVAASAGNHSQGVALASKMLGVNATIVMPKTTPLIKVDATRSHGATVILHGDCYDEAATFAKQLQLENGNVFIHPFDDLEVMAGQGTIGLEILEELPDVDVVLLPVGGGGLSGGVAAAIKALRPDVQVIGVEPEGAMTMKTAVSENRVVDLAQVRTIADGVAVKRAGHLTFEANRFYLDQIVAVPDQEIMESFCLLLEKHKLIGEASGVLTLAALKHLDLKDKKVVCLISGGNIDLVTISAMINRGLVSRGRLFCFTVELPDKPGELAKISQILADNAANVIKLDHNQFKSYDRLMNAVLEVTCETNGHDHVMQIQKAMLSQGYCIHQIF